MFKRLQQDALAAGADYFACKGDPPARLLATMRLAMAERDTGQGLWHGADREQTSPLEQ